MPKLFNKVYHSKHPICSRNKCLSNNTFNSQAKFKAAFRINLKYKAKKFIDSNPYPSPILVPRICKDKVGSKY